MIRHLRGVDGSVVVVNVPDAPHSPGPPHYVAGRRYRYGVDGLDVVHVPQAGETREEHTMSDTTTEGQVAQAESVAATALETVEEIIEKVTNTTTPAASASVLLNWVAGLFTQVATSAHPPLAASEAAATITANAEVLSHAVAANQ